MPLDILKAAGFQPNRQWRNLIRDTILGRDVLNRLVFTYDGPRRLLDILEP